MTILQILVLISFFAGVLSGLGAGALIGRKADQYIYRTTKICPVCEETDPNLPLAGA